MRKYFAVLAASAAVLASCGDSGSAAPATTKAGAETTKATTATTALATNAAPTTATTAKSATPATSSVAVTLTEWKIEGGAVKAGKVTFDAKNGGEFPHDLRVYKGSFAELPKGAGGSVDEEKLAAGVLIGKTDKIPAGASAPLAVELPAGKYSLVCNIIGGGVSHAAKGQVLDITVA